MLRHTDAWGYYLFSSESFGSSAFTPAPFNWDFVVGSTRKLLNHSGSSASLVLDRTCVCKLLSLSSRQCPQAGAQKKNKNWKKNVGGICLVYTNTPKGGFSSSLSRFRFILVHPKENLSFV